MKKNIWRLIKGLLTGILILITAVFAIYSAAWFTFTKRAEQYMGALWHDKSLTITGEVPHFTNYPLPPQTRFSGTIEHKNGLKIESPLITYSGFPVSRQIQSIEAPEGLKISADFLGNTLTVDHASLQIRLPAGFPSTLRRNDLSEWQKTGDPFQIYSIILESGTITATGSGTLSLDDKLQPVADINARVTGMDTLLDTLAAEQGERTIAVARRFYDMMSKVDAITGEKYFETTLKIQSRSIYFGPMRLTKIPEIKWND